MKPDIYKYYSYREFLTDWVAYLKKTQSGFSIRRLADKADIATGYISSVTSGKRRMSKKAFLKIAPYLKLSGSELSYFENLIEMENSNSSDLKAHALRKMNRFSGFRELNKNELRISKYLSKWYYIAIREMVDLKDFRLDADWIGQRLRFQVSKANISHAIKFLIENKFIILNSDGSLGASGDDIECFDLVYSMSLKQHYKQMFDLAKDALDVVESDSRYLLGYTFCLDKDGFDEAKNLMNQAFKKIRKLEKGKKSGQEIYNFASHAVPLTKNEKEE